MALCNHSVDEMFDVIKCGVMNVTDFVLDPVKDFQTLRLYHHR